MPNCSGGPLDLQTSPISPRSLSECVYQHRWPSFAQKGDLLFVQIEKSSMPFTRRMPGQNCEQESCPGENWPSKHWPASIGQGESVGQNCSVVLARLRKDLAHSKQCLLNIPIIILYESLGQNANCPQRIRHTAAAPFHGGFA